jgi:hypothetical protein
MLPSGICSSVIRFLILSTVVRKMISSTVSISTMVQEMSLPGLWSLRRTGIRRGSEKRDRGLP